MNVFFFQKSTDLVYGMYNLKVSKISSEEENFLYFVQPVFVVLTIVLAWHNRRISSIILIWHSLHRCIN